MHGISKLARKKSYPYTHPNTSKTINFVLTIVHVPTFNQPQKQNVVTQRRIITSSSLHVIFVILVLIKLEITAPVDLECCSTH